VDPGHRAEHRAVGGDRVADLAISSWMRPDGSMRLGAFLSSFRVVVIVRLVSTIVPAVPRCLAAAATRNV
jgi:hypothetical protein